MIDFTQRPPAMVRQIINRCHVGQSNRAVIKYFISRLRNGHTTWRALPREERRQWLRWVISVHRDNRSLYRMVMGGSRW